MSEHVQVVEPRTAAGRALLAMLEAEYSSFVGGSWQIEVDAILAIETEALAGLTLDEGRLRAAHRNLFMASGRGIFGGYIDELIEEYAALGSEK